MKIKHPAVAATLGGILLISAYSASSAPNSITDKGSASYKGASAANVIQKSGKEQIKINGLQGGKITQTQNKLIVQGGTIVAKPGEKQPAIHIENPGNKEILIQNTRIISDGAVQDNKDGSAGIVIIENGNKQGNTRARVKMDNVHVTARNSTIRAKASGGGSACAGVVCTGMDDDDEQSGNIVVDIRGNNSFEAISQ